MFSVQPAARKLTESTRVGGAAGHRCSVACRLRARPPSLSLPKRALDGFLLGTSIGGGYLGTYLIYPKADGGRARSEPSWAKCLRVGEKGELSQGGSTIYAQTRFGRVFLVPWGGRSPAPRAHSRSPQ